MTEEVLNFESLEEVTEQEPFQEYYNNEVYYEEIISELNSINSFLYTSNVYYAGFFTIVILILLIKSLVGFFKVFI